MEMTPQQRQDFNSLSAAKKKKFLETSSEHPGWTFQQVMAKLAFDTQTEEFIEKGGNDVDPNDGEVWVEVLKGVKRTLAKMKSIGQSIFNAIDGAIATLSAAINSGIKRIGGIIRKLQESLFN